MNQTLTDSEIDRLALRLSENKNPGALSLEAVDGLFCALIASPDIVRPSQYTPVILGDGSQNSRVFADTEAAKIGRNEPCPCGSGKKFKKSCGSPGLGVAH